MGARACAFGSSVLDCPWCAWQRTRPPVFVRLSVRPSAREGALCGPRRRRRQSAVPRTEPFSRAPVVHSFAITLGPQVAPALGHLVVLVVVVVVVRTISVVSSLPLCFCRRYCPHPTSCRAPYATRWPVTSRPQPHHQSRRLCHLLCISSIISNKACQRGQFLHPRPLLAHHTTPIALLGLSTFLPDPKTPPRSLSERSTRVCDL